MTALCVGPHGEGEERIAAPGRRCCTGCEDRARAGLRELPQWWADLADPRRGQRPSDGGKSAESPSPMTDASAGLRSTIRNDLVGWCLILRDDHNVLLPDEGQIIGFTRRLVLQLQEAETAARDRQDGDRAEHLRREIAEVRDTRETGADVIGGICEHLDRHAGWLLGTDHAERFIAEVIADAHQARRTAHPGRPDAVVTCPCGSRVALDVDRVRITCLGCGEWGDVGWWWDRVGADNPRPLKITELPVWLEVNHHLVVTTKQLRNWRDRGLLIALPEEAGGPGSTHRYDPAAVAIVARARLVHGDVRLSA